ncbi:MAG: hypothetical protein PHQ04_05805 [Opitutaceae bacterium]|nr:hypothetical protein [Opitutaceae bacterium]
MLFSAKTKGYVIDQGEQTIFLARHSAVDSTTLIEEINDIPTGDKEAFAGVIKTLQGSKGGYARAICGIYPPKRVVRRHSLDPKRAKDPAYLNEIFSQTFRIDPEKYTMKVLNPADGSEMDPARMQKEALFCGLPSDDILSAQDQLLEASIYPERLELTTVAMFGGLINYLKFKQTKEPVLMLEISDQSTHSFILNADGVDVTRPIATGVGEMIPVVQKELGLKDEESAQKLFYSNTFDFTGMGGQLIKKLLKELQSSIGFYEVQTGQSIAHVHCSQLPVNLGWLSATIAGALGVTPLKMDFLPWLESLNIKFADGVQTSQLNERWLGLLSLLASSPHAAAAPKKE